MQQNLREFLEDWNESIKFGAVENTSGVDRQAASVSDGEHRGWFQTRLEHHGFKVHYDSIGNQFGLLELEPGLPYVLVGSHLDSQPTAGRFDGAYGVVTALHACVAAKEALLKNGSPKFNIAVVNWFNEEGSRFKPSMMGSGVFTDKITLDAALQSSDPAGVTVLTALDSLGEPRQEFNIDVASYAEIHIQQGRSLEEDGAQIGLVHATWAAHKYEFLVSGEQGHSGATAMEDRRDALLAASRLVVAANDLVGTVPAGMLHSACGEMQIYPNSPVVVASEVRLLIDFRSPDINILDSVHEAFVKRIAEIEEQDRVSISTVSEHAWDQKPYTKEGLELARRVADDLNLKSEEVFTLAGHDSTNMNDVVPTVMIFVPSKDGVSHNVNEFTSTEDMLNGLVFMTELVSRMANGEL